VDINSMVTSKQVTIRPKARAKVDKL